LVLHRDVIPTATLVERVEPTPADHGVCPARRRLPPQTAGRLHPRLTSGPPRKSIQALGTFRRLATLHLMKETSGIAGREQCGAGNNNNDQRRSFDAGVPVRLTPGV